MQDRREALLERLDDILAAIPGVASYAANRDDANEADRPAIRLFDADEQADDGARGRGRPGHAVNLQTMSPEIHVVVDVPINQTRTELSRLRREIIRAIAVDAELHGLCTSNGEIAYEGCVTGFAAGRSFQREMMLAFSFTYPLDPEEL